MTCKDRGTVHNRPYCKRYGDYCDIWRLIWCKRDIFFAVFISVAIAFFAYGIVYAWQQAEDRVDLQRQVTENQVANHARMDDLEVYIMDLEKKITGVEKTFVRYMGRVK